jgi:thioredoxin
MVASPATKEEFDMALAMADSLGQAVLVDFTATWCGPCRMMAPVFEALAQEFDGQMTFIKIDVDANQETAQYCEISAMPTFKVFRGFQEVGAMRGANAEGLRQLVLTELAGNAHRPSRADASGSSRSAGAPPPQRAPRDAAAKQQAEQAQKAALASMLASPAHRDAARVCLTTLLKMVSNVLTSPGDSKFRSVKAENKAIKEKVLSCPGGAAMLACTGFERQAEQPLTSTPELYALPADANLAELAEVRRGIETVLAAMGPPPNL